MKTCFVIMPFSSTSSCSQDEWTDIFEQLIKPAVKECGLDCIRASVSTGSLIKSIVEQLSSSYLVIADLTDNNPNVFYELGVRHSLSKRTILIAQNSIYIPSDLRGYWSIIYGTKLGEAALFRKDMKRVIGEILEDPERSDSPISDYLIKSYIRSSQQENKRNVKYLTALYTELTGNKITLSELQKENDNFVFLSYDCLSLLLTTMYVDLGPSLQKEFYELRNFFRMIKNGNTKPTLVNKALVKNELLAKEVQDILSKITSGEFNEPDKVTIMHWLSASSQSYHVGDLAIPERDVLEKSCCEYNRPFTLNELKTLKALNLARKQLK